MLARLDVRLRSTSARDAIELQIEVARGCFVRARLMWWRLGVARLITTLPPQSWGPQAHLFLSPFSVPLVLPSRSLAATSRRLGERRRHWSRFRPALCRRQAHPPGMPSLSIFFCCARRSTPNPNKTICIQIWIQLQYLLTSISFARIIGCACVHPCSMLGPPLPWEGTVAKGAQIQTYLCPSLAEFLAIEMKFFRSQACGRGPRM